MAEELKFYKWIHNAQSNFFFCPEFYHIYFSPRPGDFSFKLVASAKILVAMVTKLVAIFYGSNLPFITPMNLSSFLF